MNSLIEDIWTYIDDQINSLNAWIDNAEAASLTDIKCQQAKIDAYNNIKMYLESYTD